MTSYYFWPCYRSLYALNCCQATTQRWELGIAQIILKTKVSTLACIRIDLA